MNFYMARHDAVFEGPTRFLTEPLWTTRPGAYFFVRERGESDAKVLVNSIPKSGTYLISKALEIAGVVNTGVHLRNAHFQDFRKQPLDLVIRDADLFKVSAPISTTLPMVAEGQFVVAHLEPTEEAIAAADGYAHILLVRNAVDALVSHMRFFGETNSKSSPQVEAGEDGPTRFKAYLNEAGVSYLRGALRQLPWVTRPEVLVVNFETIMGDLGEVALADCAAKIAQHAGLTSDFLEALSSAMGQKTRTYSGSRSDSSPFIDDEAIALLEDAGAREYNEKLGYGWPH